MNLEWMGQGGQGGCKAGRQQTGISPLTYSSYGSEAFTGVQRRDKEAQTLWFFLGNFQSGCHRSSFLLKRKIQVLHNFIITHL